MRIEVGYGLEGSITDAQSSEIIRNVLRPAFQQNAFGTGITQAFEYLIRAGGGEAIAVPAPPSDETTPTEADWPGLIVFMIFLILSIFQRLSGGRRGRSTFYSSSGFSSYSGGGSSGGFSGGGGSFGGGGASGGW